MAVAIYLYSIVALVWWLITWLGDACMIKFGFSCDANDAEGLTIRMLSLMFLYMGAIPLLLAKTNKGNDPFLKRLAFHLQYGLMAMIGCSFARSPTPPGVDTEEDSWYSIGDKLIMFLCFFILFAYTAKSNEMEGPPTIMVQPPHKGHGILPRTFLLIFGIAGILPLVKKFPLDTIVPDGVPITETAKFFYSMTQSAGLAVLMIIFVPLHFGTDEDQYRTTAAIIVIELIFGFIMFSGEAWSDWIRPSLHARLIVGPIVFAGLAILALIYGGRRMKEKRASNGYESVPSAAVVV